MSKTRSVSSSKIKSTMPSIRKVSFRAAENPDALSILRQYGKLLQHLRTATIDMKILNQFYEKLKKQNSYEAACTIRDMLAELPACPARRIKDRFEENKDKI